MSELSNESRDATNPTGPWEFDGRVTKVFDDMLSRSIPGFLDMRSLTTKIATRYAKPGTTIVDLGCSKGGSLVPIMDALTNANQYLGVEVSDPMREAAINTFLNYPNLDVSVENLDLRYSFPNCNSSVILSVLTLQFVPIEYRQRILSDAYESLCEGGVFILIEKVLGKDAHVNSLLVEIYHDLKGENGYTEEQINSKRLALEGVLVPVTSEWNVQLLENAGFRHIDCFWRNLNFAGWIGVKEIG